MYRIMIVDDEESIRQGVAALIRRRCPIWEVNADARDGVEAIEVAKTFVPHVMITDISMPHKNGLDMMESLRGILPEVKLLVLSGYDQFEYAVQALRVGVSNYMMKPVDSDALVQQLELLARELDGEMQEKDRLLHLHAQALKGRTLETRMFFTAAVRGIPLPEIRETDKAHFTGQWYCCVLCNGAQEHTEELSTILDQQMDISLKKVVLRLESPAETAIVFWTEKGEEGEFFLTLNKLLNASVIQWKRQLDRDLHFFVGTIVDHPKKLKLSFRRSLKARNYTFPDQMDGVVSYEDGLEDSMLPCKQIPEEIRRELLMAVQYENQSAFFDNSQKLFNWLQSARIRNADYIRMCILSLCYGLFWDKRNMGEMSYYEFTNFHTEIMEAKSVEELKTLFESFVRLCWMRRQNAETSWGNMVERVENIVRERLSDMNFSLDDVAAALFISPNYLRQLFKQATGQTFTEYLTAQRMQRAHLLLGNPKMKVGDVAELCGYADSRYFSVCFKKYWHMTPTEYQSSL